MTGTNRLALAEPRALTGPAFSSYSADDVAWLLTDLSGAPLEGATASREQDIQSGRRHYSETLPQEYEPSADYVAAYDAALARGALRVAMAVTVLGRSLVERSGTDLTLVSLARAGVPIGILLRRWLVQYAGVDAPHFAISIIRDRGIDTVALDYLLRRVSPTSIQFVDGWTGKGMIAQTLHTAIAAYNDGCLSTGLDSGLAVLSDPLGVAALSATSDDLLIPSACLNSTVSGLVSRTVLSAEHIHAGMFHGAKFYRSLASTDRSTAFLDAITSRFAEAQRLEPASVFSNRPRGAETADVVMQRVMEKYRITDRNRAKPGIGETTRVLLRRVPALVVVRNLQNTDLQHILVLARDRHIAIVVDADLPFACLGVIADVRGAG